MREKEKDFGMILWMFDKKVSEGAKKTGCYI